MIMYNAKVNSRNKMSEQRLVDICVEMEPAIENTYLELKEIHGYTFAGEIKFDKSLIEGLKPARCLKESC